MKKLVLKSVLLLFAVFISCPMFSGSATAATSYGSITTLRHKTALEKKAYRDLKKVNKYASTYGWYIRQYHRETLAKKYRKTWVITDVYIRGEKYNFSFRHCYNKAGVAIFQWKGKTVTRASVYGLIKNPSKYYKKK